ncbi:MAG: hypothetical protein K6D96_11180 [Acetatifactor sp.]|nr:hypothetical protein [Acetatifactor sp.]
METGKDNTRVAEGYSFATVADCELGKNEKKKIEYLESKLDYSKPATIYRIYEKALSDRTFKSPVGYEFLRKLQSFLLSDPAIDPATVSPIPLYKTYAEVERMAKNPAKQRIKPAKPKKEVAWTTVSAWLNVLFVLAIIAMFTILLKSDQPNILNYKTAIINQYSQWEEDLKARETVVKQKELELKIREE